MAGRALLGVGDARLGEWRESPGRGVVHLRRRLSVAEVAASGLIVRDIRGSSEEADRIAALLLDAPQLAPYLGAVYA